MCARLSEVIAIELFPCSHWNEPRALSHAGESCRASKKTICQIKRSISCSSDDRVLKMRQTLSANSGRTARKD